VLLVAVLAPQALSGTGLFLGIATQVAFLGLGAALLVVAVLATRFIVKYGATINTWILLLFSIVHVYAFSGLYLWLCSDSPEQILPQAIAEDHSFLASVYSYPSGADLVLNDSGPVVRLLSPVSHEDLAVIPVSDWIKVELTGTVFNAAPQFYLGSCPSDLKNVPLRVLEPNESSIWSGSKFVRYMARPSTPWLLMITCDDASASTMIRITPLRASVIGQVGVVLQVVLVSVAVCALLLWLQSRAEKEARLRSEATPESIEDATLKELHRTRLELVEKLRLCEVPEPTTPYDPAKVGGGFLGYKSESRQAREKEEHDQSEHQKQEGHWQVYTGLQDQLRKCEEAIKRIHDHREYLRRAGAKSTTEEEDAEREKLKTEKERIRTEKMRAEESSAKPGPKTMQEELGMAEKECDDRIAAGVDPIRAKDDLKHDQNRIIARWRMKGR